MTEAVDVLVVGAGPTGLLLSAELCRRGVACRVIDDHSASLPWDRATVVHPRTLEIFESLGIVEGLLAVGVKQRIARVHSDGRVLGEIDLSTCGSRYGFNVGVSEEVTEQILADYLRQRGGAVGRGSRLVGVERQDGGLLATIEHGGATEQVAAQWMVGCDGSHSVTRRIAGIELEGRDIEEPWAGCASAESHELAQLEQDVHGCKRKGEIDAAIVVSAASGDERADARLEAGAASQLGVDDVTMLVVRPDGHVGLRADRMHAEALAAYLEKLCDFSAAGEVGT